MPRFLLALLVTLTFAVIGFVVGGVTLSGAIAGFAVAFILYYCIGGGAFVTLSAAFVITWLATRVGYAHKQRLGVAENRRGRDAFQVLANLSVSAAFATAALSGVKTVATIAAIAALCEAAADTTSSECGAAWNERAYLVVGFHRVPAGTNGAVSLLGTIAGGTAAALIALVATFTGILSLRLASRAALAGFLGTVVDSLLGATLERRGLLGNNGVNLLSTLSAALIGLLLSL